MNRLVAAAATFACVIGFTAAPAPPATADTVTVGEGGWSVALTFPDWQWTSSRCQLLPVTAVVTGPVQTWTFGGFVDERQDEDSDTNWYIDYDTKVSAGAGTFTFRHAMMLCPEYDYSGAYLVDGEVGVLLAGSTDWSWLPYQAAFTVTGVPTAASLDPIVVAEGQATFTGKAGATAVAPASLRNCSDTGVVVQTLNGSEWEGIESTDEIGADGSFAITVPTYRLTGDQYRVRFRSDYSVCAPSVSEVRPLPVRLPRVMLSSNRTQSRFTVDIDPNRGRKAWTFQVQRQKDDGEWRTLKGIYRTHGSLETRTINVGKGTYRIHVKAQAGYAETYSDTVWLEK